MTTLESRSFNTLDTKRVKIQKVSKESKSYIHFVAGG
jgi:hypothetical protein